MRKATAGWYFTSRAPQTFNISAAHGKISKVVIPSQDYTTRTSPDGCKKSALLVTKFQSQKAAAEIIQHNALEIRKALFISQIKVNQNILLLCHGPTWNNGNSLELPYRNQKADMTDGILLNQSLEITINLLTTSI